MTRPGLGRNVILGSLPTFGGSFGMRERHGYDEQGLFNSLLDGGFWPVHYHPFERRLTPREVKWPRPGNILMVKDIAATGADVASSRHYRVKRTTL